MPNLTHPQPNPPLPANLPDGTAAMPTTADAARLYIIFLLAGQRFGVPLKDMQEVIQLPSLDRVPLAPASWLGIGSLRGSTVPVLALSHLLGLHDAEAEPELALILAGAQPVGLAIDRVSGVERVEAHEVEPIALATPGRDMPLLGTIQREGSLVTLLDMAALLADERCAIEATLPAGEADADRRSAATVADTRRLISYLLDGQEYATPIEQILEILPLPESLLALPRAGHSLVGIMSLRGRLLTLVSLHQVFGLAAKTPADAVVVVLHLGGDQALGVVVDSVREVFEADAQAIAALPDPFGREEDSARLDSLCQLDGGQRLVGLIDARQLARRVGMDLEGQVHAATRQDVVPEPEEDLVVFQLEREIFGIAISLVQEIVPMPSALVKLADAPAGVDGYLNLRGETLPVLDLRRQFDKPPNEVDQRRCIVLLTLDSGRVGLIVDEVREMLRVPARFIAAAPIGASGRPRAVERVANMEDGRGIIQLIEPAAVIGANALARLPQPA